MKKNLFKGNGKFYKANLHSHSTLSDGRLTPEEMKKAYKEKGYSILSLTDHEILIAHPELCDDDFLTLPGYEISVSDEGEVSYKKTCHINFYPIDENNLEQVCFSEKHVRGNAINQLDKIKKADTNYVRKYSAECVNEMVQIAKEHGFIASYNHPTWSLQDWSDYINYDGFYTVEIVNYSCLSACSLPENNERVYDDMLRAGKRLYCSATDDNHNAYGFGELKCDSFGGYVMIKADSLTHKAVMQSLIEGNFYASTGPQINELYIEDGKVHITTSAAAEIRIVNAGRRGDRMGNPSGSPIYEAVFNMPVANDRYFRLVVIDSNGNKAYTRAYFLDELED